MEKKFVVKASENSEFKREVLPAWTYVGTLYSIVDLWTQIGEWNWEPTKQRKVRLSWELPDEIRTFKEENWPQPMALHWEITLSFGEKAHLNRIISAWRWKQIEKWEEVDISEFLWKNCILTVGITKSKKNWNEYNQVTGVAPLMKGMQERELINKKVLYTIDMGINDVYNWLHDFLKEKIQKSVEYSEMVPFK